MATAEKTWTTVQEACERIKSNAPQRFPDAASVGDVWRQGDIYIERLAGVADGASVVANPSPQLAPGTTQGSQHCLDSLLGVTVYAPPRADVLTGPVLAVETERTITHPEHGDVVLPPGTYGITYQRAYADELRRVAD